MNLLFVIEKSYPIKDASARVLNKLIESDVFENDDIHILSFGNCNCFKKKNVSFHFVKEKKYFIPRVLGKLFKRRFFANLFKINSYKKHIKRILNYHKIDRTIFVLGDFNLFYCANNLNTDYFAIYYDPFIGNYFYSKTSRKKLNRIESEFLRKCKKAFLLNEYLYLYKEQYPNYSSKMISFNITSFYSLDERLVISSFKNKNFFLNCGGFFPNIRPPETLFEFADELLKKYPHFDVVSLSKLPKMYNKCTKPSNLVFHERIEGDNYLRFIGEARCLLLFDNKKEYPQIPSKLFEFISTNKKIVFFTEDFNRIPNVIRNNSLNIFIIRYGSKINDETISKLFDFIKIKETTYDIETVFYKYSADYNAKIIKKNI